MAVFKRRKKATDRRNSRVQGPGRTDNATAGPPSTVLHGVRINFDELNRRVERNLGPFTSALHARVQMALLRYRTQRQLVQAVIARRNKDEFLPRR